MSIPSEQKLKKIAGSILGRLVSSCTDTYSPEISFHCDLSIWNTAVVIVQFHFPFLHVLVHVRVLRILVPRNPVQSRIFLRNQQKGGLRPGAG